MRWCDGSCLVGVAERTGQHVVCRIRSPFSHHHTLGVSWLDFLWLQGVANVSVFGPFFPARNLPGRRMQCSCLSKGLTLETTTTIKKDERRDSIKGVGTTCGEWYFWGVNLVQGSQRNGKAREYQGHKQAANQLD